MSDDKIKKMRSWARTIIKEVERTPNHFNDGVVDAAEFILKETDPPIPEGSLLFKEAEHESRGKVTIISEKPVIGINDVRYVYTLQPDSTADSGTVCSWYPIEELDFYSDRKSDLKSRLDFHTLKTGTAIRAFPYSKMCPVMAAKASIDCWEVTGYNSTFSDQEMENLGYVWEVC